MKYAILAAGPSLNVTWPAADKSEFAKVLGVNSSIMKYECDEFVIGDPPVIEYRGLHTRVKSGICWTMMPTIMLKPNMDEGWRDLDWRCFTKFQLITSLTRPWTWSLQGAMAVAHNQGATHVSIFGCDQAGMSDCGGLTFDDRTENRWQRERTDIAHTVAVAATIGLTVDFVRDPRGSAAP